MSDIDIKALQILALIAGSKAAFDDAVEAYNHSCLNHDWEAVETNRQRAMDALSIYLNQLKVAHQFSGR